MHSLYRLALASLVMIGMPFTVAQADCDNCCSSMGGTRYCDSSAGRIVCNNGEYSACYCTRHAVMDLQEIKGCCLWHGGVSNITPVGQVMCNDGGFSEICSLQNPQLKVAAW